MISGTIWNQLVSTLQNDGNLSRYIKMVFDGRRYDIEPESMPCIMIEPVRNETSRDLNQIEDKILSVDLYAFSSNNFNDFKKTIVGDDNYKGIFDIENDIRACLSSSYSLGGIVIDVKTEATEYGDIENDKYPIRGMIMPLKIHYRQDNGV